MSSDSSFQYIGLFVFLLIIAFVFYTIFNKQLEGMTNNDSNSNSNSPNKITSHGSNAEKFSERIKSSHHTMKDKLNISNYRTDYENLIIELNDYVDGMMLNELLTIDPTNAEPTSIMKKLENINKMTNGKQNLNRVMKYLDSN